MVANGNLGHTPALTVHSASGAFGINDVAAVEAIEIVKAKPVGPAVEWPDGTCFPDRRVVVLADPRRHVSVLSKNFPNRPSAARQNSCVAVVSCGRFADHTGGRRVVVAPGDERSSCRTAQRRRMEAVVTQSLRRELIHCWRRYSAAERAELAEASVVNQDDTGEMKIFRQHPLCGSTKLSVGGRLGRTTDDLTMILLPEGDSE